MTSGDTFSPPIVRRAPRHSECLPDSVLTTQGRENLIDGHVSEVDSNPVHKQERSYPARRRNPRKLSGQNTLHANPQPARKTEAEMATDLMRDVARRLGIIREELGLSQDEMGEYLDIGRGRWLNWERARHYPSPVIMVRLCEYTGVTFDYIYRGVLAGVRQELSVRLAIREQGGNPDAPEFQGVRAKRARRAKSDV
jgi:transcriptional regulator with XRE-family HTH domain